MLDSQSVSMSIGEILPSKSVAQTLVTEPKVFPHELQQLDDTEAICVYRGRAWCGHATPYFELWPEYKGRRPAASDSESESG